MTIDLPDEEAQALAQIVKRFIRSELRACALNEAEPSGPRGDRQAAALARRYSLCAPVRVLIDRTPTVDELAGNPMLELNDGGGRTKALEAAGRIRAALGRRVLLMHGHRTKSASRLEQSRS